MNIQSSHSFRPTLAAAAPAAKAPETAEAAPAAPAESFLPSPAADQGLLKGPLGRAVYGAALYGLPALAGATMGINGVLPGAGIGAGIGAATHLQSGSQAGIFAATGAVTGGAAAYIGFLGASVGFGVPAAAVAAVVGAGTQALFALTQER